MTNTRFERMVVALSLAALMMACGDRGEIPTAPTGTPAAPSPSPSPAPVPTPSGGTLSGIVFEITPSGNGPVEGVEVYCDACGPRGHSYSITTDDGRYSIEGAPPGPNLLFLSKEGYTLRRPDWPGAGGWMGGINATVNGDTRFDIEVIKQ